MLKRLLLALALLCIVAPAYAADFTITVPVSISSLPPNIDSLWVTCQVFETSHLRVIGAASRRLPIVGGAFRGDVALEIDSSPDRDPALARDYRCVAWLIGRSATNPNQNYFEDGSRTATETFPLSPDAPFVMDTGFVLLH